MELSYLVAAVRRRPWLVAIGVLLGVALVFLPTIGEKAKYQSRALLFIGPPAEAIGGVGGAGTDRYVANQVSILQSDHLGEQVAKEVGSGQTATSVRRSVRVQQNLGTDLVDVIVVADTPELAQDIGNGYVSGYIAEVRARAEANVSPILEEVTQDIEQTKSEITALNVTITDAIRSSGSGGGNLPAPEIAAPQETAERNALLTQLESMLDRQATLKEAAKLNIGSEIVESASPGMALPTGPRKLIIVAGGMAGAILGLTLAVLVARSSNEVLDALHAEEVIGTPVTNSMPRIAQVARAPKDALTSLPVEVAAEIDQVCVRAEAAARVGGVLTVVVTGTKHQAGTTTLAMALAGRFAARGSAVLLLDADPLRPTISRMLKVGPRGSIAALLGAASRRKDATGTFVSVGGESVLVIGQPAGKESAGLLRRDRAADLLSAASAYADVVIIDGGPLLDSALAVQLTQLADAVVLAVPRRHQEIEGLEIVVRLLGGHKGELLPVMTSPTGRRVRRRSDASTELAASSDGTPHRVNGAVRTGSSAPSDAARRSKPRRARAESGAVAGSHNPFGSSGRTASATSSSESASSSPPAEDASPVVASETDTADRGGVASKAGTGSSVDVR